jgi:imidazolonepropionase-like amidohydrolase
MKFRLVALSIALAAAAAAQDSPASITIACRTLYVGDGTVVGPAVVTVANGKIRSVSVGAASITPGGDALWIEEAAITPGFVEGSSTVGLPKGLAENEESTEVTPCVRAASVLDPSDEGFRRAREAGVTTLIVAPGNRNVIGGLAVAVKPRPDVSAAKMVVKEDMALHAVLGLEPTYRNQSPRGGNQSLYARRPNSRMGVIYELRRAFQEGCERNASAPMGRSCFCDADGRLLAQVMKGDIPIAFVARAEQDILTAINIADEFKAPRFYLQGALEAYLTRDLLAKRGIPVLIGPVYHSSQVPESGGRRGGQQGPPTTLTERGGILGGPKLLKEAGVRFGLSQGSHELGSTLLDYARAAVRGGLAPGDAIAAISGWPSAIVGLGDSIGVIAPGKDADLNVWSGDPLSPTSRLVAVIIDGKVAYRAQKPGAESRRS